MLKIILLSNTTYLGGGGDVFLTTSAAADIRDNDDETVRLREIRLKAAARRGKKNTFSLNGSTDEGP